MTEPSVAVVGCGSWGSNLVRNFAELDRLKAVCDANPDARAQARKVAPDAAMVEDLANVLSSDVPGVAIATPAPTHFEIARSALEAGKHVLVEKPLALRYKQGLQLLRLAEREEKILMVGHVLEYHPAILKLREMLDAGKLGDLQYVYSNRLSLGKIRREENILWSFAPHDVAVMLRLVGDLPLKVSATGGSYIQPNIPDTTVTHLLFQDGTRGHIYVSWLHPFKEQRLVVIGSRRMVTFDDVAKELVLYDQRVEIGDDGPVPVREDQGQKVAFPDDEPLRLECEAFLNAMATGETPLTDGLSGVRVLKVLQAAQRSLTAGGAGVDLPFEGGRRIGTSPITADSAP